MMARLSRTHVHGSAVVLAVAVVSLLQQPAQHSVLLTRHRSAAVSVLQVFCLLNGPRMEFAGEEVVLLPGTLGTPPARDKSKIKDPKVRCCSAYILTHGVRSFLTQRCTLPGRTAVCFHRGHLTSWLQLRQAHCCSRQASHSSQRCMLQLCVFLLTGVACW